MKKVLIHLGLPKTATSSLQQNVLQKLHDDHRVNFLGKNLEVCDKKGKVTIFNYEGKVIRKAIDGKETIDKARLFLKKNLQSNKLNVFSDEGIMVCYPGENNLPLVTKFNNLQKIFEGYQIKVVMTLRDPVDYFYSLYVQLFPDFYSNLKGLNTFEKYFNKLLKQPDDLLFESFHYHNYLPILDEMFELNTITFEDIKNNKHNFYKFWGELLSITSQEFETLFEKKHVNKKNKKNNGSNKVFTLKRVELYLRSFLNKDSYLFNTIKFFYWKLSINKITNRRFNIGMVHKKPNMEKRMKIYEALNTQKKYRLKDKI